MTRTELEEIWRSKSLQYWGNVACWDNEGKARPGAPLSPECGAEAKAFRVLIDEINRRHRSKMDAPK